MPERGRAVDTFQPRPGVPLDSPFIPLNNSSSSPNSKSLTHTFNTMCHHEMYISYGSYHPCPYPTLCSHVYAVLATITEVAGYVRPCTPSVICSFRLIFFQHFHGRYYTGETKDCNSMCCKTSVHHKHKTSNCGCPEVREPTPFYWTIILNTELSFQVVMEERKIQNLFQIPFPECQHAR